MLGAKLVFTGALIAKARSEDASGLAALLVPDQVLSIAALSAVLIGSDLTRRIVGIMIAAFASLTILAISLPGFLYFGVPGSAPRLHFLAPVNNLFFSGSLAWSLIREKDLKRRDPFWSHSDLQVLVWSVSVGLVLFGSPFGIQGSPFGKELTSHILFSVLTILMGVATLARGQDLAHATNLRILSGVILSQIGNITAFLVLAVWDPRF